MRSITAAALLAGFVARNHISSSSVPGTVDLSASAEAAPEETRLETVQAMAVKGFAAVSGPLQYVRAKEHFYVAGESVFTDDYVQVTAEDAKRLVNAGRAELASDDDVAAAQKGAKAK